MKNVFFRADNICSPLGRDTAENLDALRAGRSGIRLQENRFGGTAYYAALLTPEEKRGHDGFTPFESLVLASVREALDQYPADLSDERTGFILSSTKGNISLLESADPVSETRLGLGETAGRIARALSLKSHPVVVSHACISGLLALITAQRLIVSGRYDQVIVTGADLITEFILSGFQSFLAVSAKPCRPFDADRDGISLGEGAATVILSAKPAPGGSIRLAGGAVSNDANHISGPSRTGAELFDAIGRSMREAGAAAGEIGFISAHGTATRYNDDMEARAVNLAGLASVPLNSLKGNYGHTLGAAGLIESVIAAHSLQEDLIFPTLGFENPGTEQPVNVIRELMRRPVTKCLKTASGFGGCNAALVLDT